MKAILSTVTLLALTATTQAATGKCYALAFSSGHEDGAYQAGVIKGLADNLPADQVGYDSISGVSCGAVNAALFGSFAKGSEKEAGARLEKFWTDATKQALYEDWFGGVLEGLFYKGGVYDDTKLVDFLKTEFSSVTSMERSVHVGITNILNGHWTEFDSSNITANLLAVMQSSFTYPGIFPPTKFEGSEWFDGSAIWALDAFSAINKCRDMGFDDADIVADTVLTSNAVLGKVDASKYTSLSMLYRFLEISSYYSSLDGLLRAKFAYPRVNFRYSVAPSKALPWHFKPLEMTAAEVQTMISLGESDAKSAVAKGDGVSTDVLVHFYSLKKSNDERVADLSLEEFAVQKEQGLFEEHDFENDSNFIKFKLMQN